jgi:type IV secretory pathway VirB2 component (pilin)
MMTSKSHHSGAISAIEQAQENKRVTRFVLTSALVCLVAFEPSIAAATTTGTGTTGTLGNIDSVATKVLTALTGTFAKTIATIAVVVLGLMAMFGKLAWDHALKVIFGIALVFGAAGIVTAVSGVTI